MFTLSDSDFARCKDTFLSTSGYMVLMNGGVVAYYSGRQSTVALCTAMAETIALAKLAVKIKHMRAILFDLQCRQDQNTMIHSTCVWVDNAASIAVAKGNDFTHETVKHVTVKVRFIVCAASDYSDLIYQDEQEYCRHHDQAICWTSVLAASRLCSGNYRLHVC